MRGWGKAEDVPTAEEPWRSTGATFGIAATPGTCEELLTAYRVADYLAAFEENRRQIDHGLRERLMKDGIRLSERLSPRIYRIFGDLCTALELEIQAEVFCLPSQEMNAFATLDVRKAGTYSLIGVTAGALERLEDAELKAILGHELGHILFGNNRLAALISTDANNPSMTVLPALGESLFLRWRKKAEISADRVAILACRDFKSAATALMRATFGLSERNLNMDIEALIGQIDEIRGRPELIEATFASHPLLPIRLKAAELFSRSAKARRAGYPGDGPGHQRRRTGIGRRRPRQADAALSVPADAAAHHAGRCAGWRVAAGRGSRR